MPRKWWRHSPSQYRLATLVGAKTAGRLVATSAFNVGLGCRVALPVAAYHTWHGTNLAGRGVPPDIEEPLSPEAVWSGMDNQLKRAIDSSNQAVPTACISVSALLPPRPALNVNGFEAACLGDGKLTIVG